MAETKTRYDKTCSICGSHYKYCNCAEYAHLPRWMDAYCSFDCKELYNIAAGYINGWKTPQEELERLKAIKIPDRNKLSEWMNKAIDEILELDKVDFKELEEKEILAPLNQDDENKVENKEDKIEQSSFKKIEPKFKNKPNKQNK